MDIYGLKVKIAKVLNKMVIRKSFELPNKVKYKMFNDILKEYKYDKSSESERNLIASICSKRVINEQLEIKVFCWFVVFMILSILSGIALKREMYILTLLEYVGILLSLVNTIQFTRLTVINRTEIKELESINNYMK